MRNESQLLILFLLTVGIIYCLSRAYSGLVYRNTSFYWGWKKIWIKGKNAQFVGVIFVLMALVLIYFFPYYL